MEFKCEADRAHRAHPNSLISEQSLELMKLFMLVAFDIQNSPCLGMLIVQNTASIAQVAAEEKRKKSFYTMRTAVLRLKLDREKVEKAKDSPEATEKALRQQIADLEKEKLNMLQKDYTTLTGLLGKGKEHEKSGGGGKS